MKPSQSKQVAPRTDTKPATATAPRPGPAPVQTAAIGQGAPAGQASAGAPERTRDPGGEGVPPKAAGGGSDDHGSGPEGNCEAMGRSPFRHGEAELARLTGLHATALATARKNAAREGVDWALVKNRVAYSEAGVRVVVEFLTGSIEDDVLAGVPLAEVLEQTLLEELRAVTEPVPTFTGVVCAFYVNRQLIGVRLEGHQDVVNVRVATAQNFARGMEVPLKKTADGRYELARKLPRHYGKW